MSKSTPLMILTAAALFSGVAGAATRTTVKPAMNATTTKSTAKPMMASTSKTVAKPATVATTKTVARPAMTMSKPMAPAARPAPAMKMAAARPATTGRMVSAKLSNGKTVTYNCSLAGNATKKACK